MRGGTRNARVMSIGICVGVLVLGLAIPAIVGASPLPQATVPPASDSPVPPGSDNPIPPSPAPEVTHEPPPCREGDCPPTVVPAGDTPLPPPQPAPVILRCGSLLPLGRPQQGVVAGAGRECRFRFTGRAGWTLRLSVKPVTRGMTLNVAVYDSKGNLVAGPVKGTPGSQVEVAMLLESDGEQSIRVNGDVPGQFAISIATDFQLRGQATCGGRITFGIPASGVITTREGRCEHYFQGRPQERFHIVMTPNRSSIEPMVLLQDPAGQVWRSAGNRDDTLDLTVQITGKHTLIARDRYDGTGAYTITITLLSGERPAASTPAVAAPQATPQPPAAQPTAPQPVASQRTTGQATSPAGCNVSLYAGSTMSGSLTQSNPKCTYLLMGTSGRTLTLTLEPTSGGLDPYLELVGPGGAIVAVNNDNPAGGKGSVIRYTFPAGSALFKAVVSANSGASTGGYRLRLAP